MVDAWPFLIAQKRAVRSLSSSARKCAPAFSSSETTAECPFYAAYIKVVIPDVLQKLGVHPARNSALTLSTSPRNDAASIASLSAALIFSSASRGFGRCAFQAPHQAIRSRRIGWDWASYRIAWFSKHQRYRYILFCSFQVASVFELLAITT